MNIFTLSSLLAFIFNIILAVYVYYNNKEKALNKTFTLLTILIALWCTFPFLTYILNPFHYKLWISRIIYNAAFFVPPLFTHFSYNLINIDLINNNWRKIFLKTIYVISCLFICINIIKPELIIKSLFMIDSLFNVVPGIFYLIFLGFYCIVCFYSFIEIFFSIIKKSNSNKNQQIYVLVAYIFGYVSLIIFAIPPIFLIKEPLPHDILVIITMLIITYAIIKHQLMDIKVAITRATVFAMSYGFIFGLPFIIFAFWRQQIHSLFYHFPWIIPATVMGYAGLATITPFVYIRLESKAKSIIFAKQRHYQRLLLESSKALLREHSLNRLLNLTVDIIKKTVKINFVTIFLKDQNDKDFVLKVIKGDKSFPASSFSPDRDNFIKLLKKKKSSLVTGEINPKISTSVEKKFKLIVPIFIEDKFIGFLGLGEKEDNSLYTEDDINVFEILSRQVALAIDHCNFLEEFSKTQEKIFQAEKLASIGGMADGVAHQIKNRLNFFSIVSGEIKSEADYFMKKNYELIDKNPELKNYLNYVSEIGDSLINNVRKTNSIIEGILSFARTGEKGNFFSDFSLKEIIDTALGLLLVKHHINEFPLKIENESSDIIYGVKSQLLECIYNVLDNCYEAIKEKIEFNLTEDEKKKFKPIIKLQLKQKGNYNLLEINDNGIGIKDENKQKIFAPFFTTKPSNKSGTGIGMYVVKRIIEENHQGSVYFESEYMKGTKIFIKIPKKDSPKVVAKIRKSDLILQN